MPSSVRAESHGKSFENNLKKEKKIVWLRWKQALFLIPNFHLSFSYLDLFGAVEKKEREKYIFIKDMVLIPIHEGCAKTVC